MFGVMTLVWEAVPTGPVGVGGSGFTWPESSLQEGCQPGTSCSPQAVTASSPARALRAAECGDWPPYGEGPSRCSSRWAP